MTEGHQSIIEQSKAAIRSHEISYSLPSHILNAHPSSPAATKRLQLLQERLVEVQKQYFLVLRKKRFLDFVTSRRAELWVQKQAELESKEENLEKSVKDLDALDAECGKLSAEVSESLTLMHQGKQAFSTASKRVDELERELNRLDADGNRLVNVEKIWEKKSTDEIESILQELQDRKTDIEQVIKMRKAIKEDKEISLGSLHSELDELVTTVAYLTDKANEGRKTAKQRLEKRAAIKAWYDNSSDILSSIIGFKVTINKKSHCICANFVCTINGIEKELEVIVKLNREDASIDDVSVSAPYPVTDLVVKAKAFDDFSWLLRQIHHRFVTFNARQVEIDDLIRSGKNLIYNMSQSPDTILAIVNESVYAFELSRKYPCPSSDTSSKPLITLVSAESAKPEIVTNVKNMMKNNVSLEAVLTQISGTT